MDPDKGLDPDGLLSYYQNILTIKAFHYAVLEMLIDPPTTIDT